MTDMKRCECQGGFDVEIIAPDGTPITFPTRAEMQNALIAQYDAIVAAVEEALRGQQWYGNRPELKIENEIRQNIKFRIDASIAKHDPRKGAE